MEPLATVPDRIVAGDSVTIQRSFSAVDDGSYALKLRFVPINGAIVTVTSPESTSPFTFPVAPTDLANVEPGAVPWTITAEKTGERITLDSGTIEVLPDPANATTAATTNLAHIERVISVCRAIIENKITADVQMYQLPGGVTVSKLTMREVRQLLASYQAQRATILRRGRPQILRLGYAIR